VSGSLGRAETGDLIERARDVSAAHRKVYPGDRAGRQPLHTLYVPADAFTERTTVAFGEEALALLETHAPDAVSFGEAFEFSPPIAERVRARVLAKLSSEPVEDVRIDFEDGYRNRSHEEEDRHAFEAAEAVAGARANATLPPSFGLRPKSFADATAERSLRTVDVFLTTLVRAAGGLPDGFTVTFPKVVAREHVVLFARGLGRLETALGLDKGALGFEIQVETPQSIVDPAGAFAARPILEAAGGRLSAMHFGVFDYTASLGLMPWEQRLDHPANDFARQVMQVALAGTGVRVADGSTNVVPASDGTDDVHAAWRAHARHVRHSLGAGFYQGWDLHPSHLVSRYAAVYGWLLPQLEDAMTRVRASRALARTAGVLDEPATVTSLLRYLRFAVSSGAVDEAEVLEGAGLTPEELG
jgi:citrate lyase beta subunit